MPYATNFFSLQNAFFFLQFICITQPGPWIQFVYGLHYITTFFLFVKKREKIKIALIIREIAGEGVSREIAGEGSTIVAKWVIHERSQSEFLCLCDGCRFFGKNILELSGQIIIDHFIWTIEVHLGAQIGKLGTASTKILT